MKKAIILGLIFTVITLGAVLFVFLQIKDIQKNRALTIQLSPALLEKLKEKQISDFPYNPAPVQWDGKYLQVEYGSPIVEGAIAPLYFAYNKKRNEKLNTDRFFPGNDIKGIVWLNLGVEIVGHYTNGGNAMQPYYVLSYLDLEKEAVLARDTIWGDMPPKTTNSYGGATGKNPKEEEVIKVILSRTTEK